MTRITNFTTCCVSLISHFEGLLTVTWATDRLVEAKSGEDNITRAESKFALDKRSFWEALGGQPIDDNPVRHDDDELDNPYNGYTARRTDSSGSISQSSPSSSLLSSFSSTATGNQSQDGKDSHDRLTSRSLHSLQPSATQSSVTYRLPLLHESGRKNILSYSRKLTFSYTQLINRII